jgi:8-oxo-dGTP diphosphatase
MNEPNAASVALMRDGEVLLIKRAFEPFKGMWTLPGGRHEAGESIEETAAREILEELGLAVTNLRPVLAMRIGQGFQLQVFASDRFSGEIVASTEIAGWQWLRPDAIGSLQTTPELNHVLDKAMALFSDRNTISESS